MDAPGAARSGAGRSPARRRARRRACAGSHSEDGGRGRLAAQEVGRHRRQPGHGGQRTGRAWVRWAGQAGREAGEGQQRLAQAALQQREDGAFVGQLDSGFGRVHVGVDAAGGQIEEDRRDRVAPARQQLRVGLLDGALQRSRADRAAVDEESHGVAAAAVVRGRRRQPSDAQRARPILQLALATEGDRGGRRGRSPDRREGGPSRFQIVDGWGGVRAALGRVGLSPWGGGQARRAEHAAALDAQLQRDLGSRQRGLAADPRDGGALAARPGQEAPPGRLPREEVAQLDRRAGRGPGRFRRIILADGAVQAQSRAQARVVPPADAVDAGDGGHAGQRLAAEAVAVQPREVVQAPQLGGGVAPEGERQVFGPHAGAVVAHEDAFQAGAVDLDLDAAGAGVAGILQQLLDGGGGPLDDLAGGDRVGHGGGQLGDARRLGIGHPGTSRSRCAGGASGSCVPVSGVASAGPSGPAGGCNMRARSRSA